MTNLRKPLERTEKPVKPISVMESGLPNREWIRNGRGMSKNHKGKMEEIQLWSSRERVKK
jgi:hypothetical protein